MAVGDMGVLVGALERAAQQLVWHTPFEKRGSVGGLVEERRYFERPARVAYHGLGIGRAREGLVIEAFASYAAHDERDARRLVASLMQLPATRIRLIWCDGIEAHVRSGGPGGHHALMAVGGYGTIGGFAGDLYSNLILAVSNNHVFAEVNRAQIGDELFDEQQTAFGRLHRYRPLAAPPQVNDLDGAVGSIYADRRRLAPRGMRVTGIGTPVLGMQVQKWGAKTGHTVGRIRSIRATPTVNYKGVGAFDFRAALRIVGTDGPFSEPGDSGSLVLDGGGGVVGIVFAGDTNGTFSLANPVGALTGGLGITF